MSLTTALPHVATHNGTYTLENLDTGNHRTIRIKTMPNDAGFAPGQRVAELLIGPDNTNDYQGFAFVETETGVVRLWKRYQDSAAYRWYRSFLVNPDPDRFPQIKVYFEGRCRVCNRALTTPESIEAGIGPICLRNIS